MIAECYYSWEVSVKEIPLTQGKVALVDDEDYEEVMRHRWYVRQCEKSRTTYASARVGYGRKGTRTVYMHRLVLGDDPDGRSIDHVNLNGLDNRRVNLRWATRAEQRRNQAVRRDSKSGLKGVYLSKGRYWTARIRCDGKQYHLGYFPTAEDAARAYDAKARELHGDFAYLNFPPETCEVTP